MYYLNSRVSFNTIKYEIYEVISFVISVSRVFVIVHLSSEIRKILHNSHTILSDYFCSCSDIYNTFLF